MGVAVKQPQCQRQGLSQTHCSSVLSKWKLTQHYIVELLEQTRWKRVQPSSLRRNVFLNWSNIICSTFSDPFSLLKYYFLEFHHHCVPKYSSFAIFNHQPYRSGHPHLRHMPPSLEYLDLPVAPVLFPSPSDIFILNDSIDRPPFHSPQPPASFSLE